MTREVLTALLPRMETALAGALDLLLSGRSAHSSPDINRGGLGVRSPVDSL